MKSTGLVLLGFGLLTSATLSCAQDKPSWKNDPTYSTGNYKHTNKATAARQAEATSGIVVTQPTPGSTQLADYKKQQPNRLPAGGVTVQHTPSTDIAGRNYKIQGPVRTRQAENADAVARKRNRTTSDQSETGN